MNTAPPKLLISEHFTTLQGEGMFTGVPSLFIRTSGCNLRCWFCDTPYTSHKPEGELKTVAQIIGLIQSYSFEHVVITGGEPMLYPGQLAQIINLCPGHFITIETNGTRYDERVKPEVWSISPKLKSSAPTDTRSKKIHAANLHSDALLKYADEANTGKPWPKYQFKFVVSGLSLQEDIQEITDLVTMYNIPRRCVWLMPEGTFEGFVIRGARPLAEVCKERGWNLSMRMHTILWGNKRGV